MFFIYEKYLFSTLRRIETPIWRRRVRYAVISDIHANFEALTATLDLIKTLEVDQIVCMGDLVGYNANPNEVVDLFREQEIPLIMGNHDAVACGLENPWNFNPIAREAALWTRRALTEENSRYLRELPTEIVIDDRFVMVHGSLHHRDQYLFSQETIESSFELLRKRYSHIHLAFFGHTHYQIAYVKSPDSLQNVIQKTIPLDSDPLYLINPGSVGQPRDQDPRAAFLVYDDQAREVETFRLAYDIEACYQKIIDAGLPAELAERLLRGL